MDVVVLVGTWRVCVILEVTVIVVVLHAVLHAVLLSLSSAFSPLPLLVPRARLSIPTIGDIREPRLEEESADEEAADKALPTKRPDFG